MKHIDPAPFKHNQKNNQKQDVMKPTENCRQVHDQSGSDSLPKSQFQNQGRCLVIMWYLIPVIAVSMVFAKCKKETSSATTPTPVNQDPYNITQAISDEAQQNTYCFDGLAYLTGNLGSQSFLPPGKVADYSGFQYLRDNDPTNLGHNTSFVTIIAFNILHILTTDRISVRQDNL
jgi:hypothetical protein